MVGSSLLRPGAFTAESLLHSSQFTFVFALHTVAPRITVHSSQFTFIFTLHTVASLHSFAPHSLSYLLHSSQFHSSTPSVVLRTELVQNAIYYRMYRASVEGYVAV